MPFLKWHNAPLIGLTVYVKLKVKVSIYFVTSMFSFILNTVSTKLLHKNENRRIGFDAFDLQFGSLYILSIFIL